MKLIDTNVIVYASGAPHDYQESSRQVMSLAYRRSMDAAVSTEILQELMHYYRKRGNLAAALRAFDDCMTGLPQPFPIDHRTAAMARDILAVNPVLQTRDAFHAATVFQHNLEGIISADRGFDIIDGLTRFDPKELTV